ncbi:lipid droplet-associated perilipin protein [Lentinula raphanica]|nr:lipid droplet-associated perilipin protein [Lentinula raphanica]KAJ3828138.1 lipid droplet-associated perilipin protein [Lentinula raphanica]KAJ3976480.1 lipid droplet-associated perilipin protein [Lentinula raphanica]
MSSTQTETSTIPMPSPPSTDPPEFTVISRISSIPLISSSLDIVNGTLSTNAYTRSPYTKALGLSNSAYKFTEPLQAHLAPLIIRADSYANLAVDAVQKRYPNAFTATPEDVMGYVQNRQKDVGEYVRERRESAGAIAQNIDKKFTPIVDYLEVAVNRIDSNAKENGAPGDKHDQVSQYSRALELSVRLRDQLQFYSNEQMKQLQAHSVLVQRATETARSLGATASSSLSNAQAKLHAVSDNMIAELGKLQAQASALSASLQASASQTLKDPAAQLPPQIQQRYAELTSALHAQASTASATYADLSNNLASTVTELRGIMAAENVSMQEKATRVTHEVSARVQPLLEVLNRTVQQAMGRTAAPEMSPPTMNGVNGHTS